MTESGSKNIIKTLDDYEAIDALENDKNIVFKELQLTHQQSLLLKVLGEKNEKLAKIYYGSLRALKDSANPTRFELCAHSMRDLMNIFSKHINKDLTTTRVSLKNKVDNLKESFSEARRESNFFKKPNNEETEILDQHLIKYINESNDFFSWYESDHPENRKKTKTMLNYFGASIGADKWEEFYNYFVGIAHFGEEVCEEEFLDKLEAFENFLLDSLFFPQTFDKQNEIDKLLEEVIKQPHDHQVQKALDLISERSDIYGYFFSTIEIEWLDILDQKKFFYEPPNPYQKGDEITHEFWPASNYLKRMASKAPEHVIKIIDAIPETDNFQVHSDLAEAVTKIPVCHIIPWVKKEIIWLKKQEFLHFLLLIKLGELAKYLAENDKKIEALNLMRELLLNQIKNNVRPSHTDIDLGLRQLTQKYFPSILKANGIKAFRLLCDLLDLLVENENTNESDNDLSWVYRPTIEPHEQFRNPYDLRNIFIDLIRDSGNQLIRDSLDLAPPETELPSVIINHLVDRNKPLFSRIALHLLREHHELLRELAVMQKVMEDKSYFFNKAIAHEYKRLIDVMFPYLPADNQNQIFEWINEGPSDSDKEVNAEYKEYNKFLWQVGILCILEKYLSPYWKDRYEELSAVVGKPEHPDLPFFTTIHPDYQSPKTEEELNQHTIEEIADFLKVWKPTLEFGAPNPRGLARKLENVVSNKSEDFIHHIHLFTSIESTYIGAIISGIHSACEKGIPIDWAKLVEYLSFIVDQPRSSEEKKHNRNWQNSDELWPRQATIRLIRLGLEKNIDIALRNQIWKIIETLTHDLSPTYSDDQKVTTNLKDQSINIIREEAMHAVMAYAAWIYRAENDLFTQTKNTQKFQFNMNMIPEARTVLEEHLNPQQESSPYIRGIYGWYLHQLTFLDRDWVLKHLHLIFPTDNQLLHHAAWDTYIVHNGFYDQMFDILKDKYEIAVNQIGTQSEERRKVLRNPDEELGHHLLTMTEWGLCFYNDNTKLLQTYFEKTPDDISAQVIRQVGIRLRKDENYSEEVIERLRSFWEALFESIKLSDSTASKTETLQAFATWFSSGRFDLEWSLKQLNEILEISQNFNDIRNVIEKLAEISPSHSESAFRILERLVQKNPEGWLFVLYKTHMLTILKYALENKTIFQDAKNTINKLGATGLYPELKDLYNQATL